MWISIERRTGYPLIFIRFLLGLPKCEKKITQSTHSHTFPNERQRHASFLTAAEKKSLEYIKQITVRTFFTTLVEVSQRVSFLPQRSSLYVPLYSRAAIAQSVWVLLCGSASDWLVSLSAMCREAHHINVHREENRRGSVEAIAFASSPPSIDLTAEYDKIMLWWNIDIETITIRI